MSSFFLQCSVAHRDLHSFPTRRSSDLSICRSVLKSEITWMSSRKPMIEMRSCGLAVRKKSRAALRMKSIRSRSEEHTSELHSRLHLVCRLLLEKKKKDNIDNLYKHIHA